MIEATIRTENEAMLQQLLDIISTLGFQVVGQKEIKNGKAGVKEDDQAAIKVLEPIAIKEEELSPELPIKWAEEPEKATELFGILEGKQMGANELRKQAWGDRL